MKGRHEQFKESNHDHHGSTEGNRSLGFGFGPASEMGSRVGKDMSHNDYEPLDRWRSIQKVRGVDWCEYKCVLHKSKSGRQGGTFALHFMKKLRAKKS